MQSRYFACDYVDTVTHHYMKYWNMLLQSMKSTARRTAKSMMHTFPSIDVSSRGKEPNECAHNFSRRGI